MALESEKKIFWKFVKKHCPPDALDEEDETVKALINAITIQRQRQEEWWRKAESNLEPAIVTETEDYEF